VLPVLDYKLRIRLAPFVPVAVLASAALAACGGSSPSHGGSTPYGPRSSPIAVSRCMRANGVPNFPDPSEGPDGGGVGFPGGLFVSSNGSMVVDGVSVAGPALANAEKVCKAYLPPSGPPPKLSASKKLQLLAYARCMRTHGVPNFPDPTFTAGGGALSAQVKLGPGINQASPAVQRAAKACGLLRP
jgi:hypothetical protein